MFTNSIKRRSLGKSHVELGSQYWQTGLLWWYQMDCMQQKQESIAQKSSMACCWGTASPFLPLARCRDHTFNIKWSYLMMYFKYGNFNCMMNFCMMLEARASPVIGKECICPTNFVLRISNLCVVCSTSSCTVFCPTRLLSSLLS